MVTVGQNEIQNTFEELLVRVIVKGRSNTHEISKKIDRKAIREKWYPRMVRPIEHEGFAYTDKDLLSLQLEIQVK